MLRHHLGDPRIALSGAVAGGSAVNRSSATTCLIRAAPRAGLSITPESVRILSFGSLRFPVEVSDWDWRIDALGSGFASPEFALAARLGSPSIAAWEDVELCAVG